MSPPIRVGFVGLSSTGWAASALAPSLLQPGSIRDKFKIVAVSTTSEASLRRERADCLGLVVVSVKDPLHKQVVLPVIEAKKPFFLEWPAGTGLKETVEIAEAARKHGVKSIVGRNSTTVKKVKELIKSGAIGTVLSSIFIGFVPRELGVWPPLVNAANAYTIEKLNGKILLLLTPLLMSSAGSLQSMRLPTIYPTATIIGAEADGRDGATNPDHYSISGHLKSGALATIVWRTGYPSTKGRRNLLWEIDGEDGYIRVESDTSSLGAAIPTVYLNGEKVDIDGTETGLFGILGAAWEPYAKEEKGQYATIEDAVKNQQILDAVERSLEAGRTIIL
ncbi:hypothetical protein BDZ97DRAFT_1757019 [Flammula alnicola]|nr:hypothetical protein BDZ97DRAFT_1757019 [Flammula alnicola]